MATIDELADAVTGRLNKKMGRCSMCKVDYPSTELKWPADDLYLCPRCYKEYMAHRERIIQMDE